MADLSITAANVVPGANAVIENGTAGEAVAAGKTGYYDEVQRKYFLADNNSATLAVRKSRGMFVNTAAANQPCSLQTGGDVALGSVLTAGAEYLQSDTPGGICPRADLASGEYVVPLGYAKSATELTLNPKYTGVQL